MNPEMRNVCDRLGRLERENRILKRVGIAAVLLAVSVAIMGQARPNRTIEADKVIVRDSRGHARITIGTASSSGYAVDSRADDPLIWLSDGKGVDRAILGMDGLRFADEYGRGTASYEAH
jgi:hypothetical protein